MRDIKKDIENFKIRRKTRMDERKARFDFEVGVYPADEVGDREPNHGNTRLPYGLCKAAGIDATDMTPREAWDALYGKTGMKAKDAYKKLEKEGSAEKLAKEAEKLAKKKKKTAKEPDEVAGTEEFEPKVTVAPDKPIPALTPTTFSSMASKLKSESDTVNEFAKKIEEQIMPRVIEGQTVAAGGRTYYCNGSGFETERGEERTRAFVAYRLARYSMRDHKTLTLSNTSTMRREKERAKESAKEAASSQFRRAMSAARITLTSGTTDGESKCRKHVMKVLEELPVGSKISYPLIDKFGDVTRMAVAEKVSEDRYYLDTGEKKEPYQISKYLTKSLSAMEMPTLEADDLVLPGKLMTTSGYEYSPETKTTAKRAPSSTPHRVVSASEKSMLRKSGDKIKVYKARKVPVSEIPTLRNDSRTRSLWRAVHSRMFKKADEEAIQSGMRRLLDENEYCLKCSGNILGNIITGGFKQQIEVLEGGSAGDGMSYANADERRKASKKLFGTPIDTPADEYEKYGYLGNPWGTGDMAASAYGDVTVVFDKDKLKDRVTYSLGDSLGPAVNRGMVAGTCGDTPSFEGWYLSRPKAKALQLLKEGASLSEILSDTKNPYLELQYHGKLTIDDVKCLVFDSAYEYRKYVTAEMQQVFDEIGIEVSIR